MPKPLNNGYCLSNFHSGEITARYSLTKWDTTLLKRKEQENLLKKQQEFSTIKIKM